jgi:multicomponent Na+:H+ antiporter subunit B
VKHQGIPRVVSKLFIPPILLFALYVQFHGDFGPGGGFQAGVIFAAAVVLYAIVFGLEAAKRIVKPRVIEILVALGVLLYAGTGLVSLYLGHNFLDYGALDSHDPAHGQHLGIFLVELGVGITVAAVMITIFFAFAGRRRLR